jgi:hypothetical protein
MTFDEKCDRKLPVTGWPAGYSPNQSIQRVRPRESDAFLLNPHKGTTTFQRFNGDPLYPGLQWDDRVGPTEFPPFDGDRKNNRYPDTTLSYCRWLWSVIEPEKGEFRWEIIEGALEAARLRGQTLQARIQPYIGDDLPAWLWEMGCPVMVKDVDNGRKEPEHNHDLYINHWSDFVRAFAARFDGHPNLESFDVAYGGACGEMGGNATPETAARLVDAYLESFTKTQLVSMLGTPGCAYAAKKKGLRIGWRADCIGDLRADGRGVMPDRLCWNHMHDAYPKEVVTDGVQEAWRTGPVTLETCWTVGHWYEKGWDIDWILDQGLKYHPSVFMPKSCYIPEAWADKIERFNKQIGYRFVLRQVLLPIQVKRGKRIDLEVWIDNVGVAPIYRPYRLAYLFRQGADEEVVLSRQDVRKWLPGHSWFPERITIPKSLRPGGAQFGVGIVDEANTPVVRLAIKEVCEDGWHLLTTVQVT